MTGHALVFPAAVHDREETLQSRHANIGHEDIDVFMETVVTTGGGSGVRIIENTS
jgi:hypothetical protein